MRVQVSGTSESTAVLRSYLHEAGDVVVWKDGDNSEPDYIIHLEERKAQEIYFESLQCDLERDIIRHVRQKAIVPIVLCGAPNNRPKHIIRIVFPPSQSPAVELGVQMGLADHVASKRKAAAELTSPSSQPESLERFEEILGRFADKIRPADSEGIKLAQQLEALYERLLLERDGAIETLKSELEEATNPPKAPASRPWWKWIWAAIFLAAFVPTAKAQIYPIRPVIQFTSTNPNGNACTYSSPIQYYQGTQYTCANNATYAQSGGTVSVNGSMVTSPNFGNSPAAPTGFADVPFQVSGSNISATTVYPGENLPTLTITQSGSTSNKIYGYCVVGTDTLGGTRSICATTGSGFTTLTGSNFNIITIGAWSSSFPYVAPVGSCNVYRTFIANSGSPTTTGLIGTIASCASGGSLNDTGLAGNGASVPVDTSGAATPFIDTVVNGQISHNNAVPPVYSSDVPETGTPRTGLHTLTSPFDIRINYNVAIPSENASGTDDWIISPINSFMEVAPNNSVDNHAATWTAVHGSVHSTSSSTLAAMAGGMFDAVRGINGSGNPLYGVLGSASMGDGSVASGVNGDGAIGGWFTALPTFTNSKPFVINSTTGFAGVVGRTVVNNGFTLSTTESVGVAGNVEADTFANTAEAMWASVSGTMSKVGNAYGLNIQNISGAGGVNMALHTGTGTVQFGGDLVVGGNAIGNLTLNQVSTPVIGTVGSVCNAFGYSCANNGAITYTYQIVACYDAACSFHSPASSAVSTTTGVANLAAANSQNIVYIPTAVEGAANGYKVYRTVAGGTGNSGTTGLIATVAQNAIPSFIGTGFANATWAYIDNGAAGDASSPATTNTTGTFTGATTIQTKLIYSAAGTPLPTCNGAAEGTQASVSDATAPTYAANYTSGGTVHVQVYCNGTNWITD